MRNRLIGLLLTIAVICSLCPAFSVVSADTDEFASLTCSSFISNTTRRQYIDTMMKYYISSNSDIVTALNNGKSAIFMFEGGSDNYTGSGYSTAATNTRNQAVCIVVQKQSGSYKIVFYNENSSSIPSQPQATSGGASDGQTTLLDGIYKVITWNHQSKYGALQVVTNKGYYTPPSNLNGLVNTASGINIHTRTTTNAESGGSAWSWGCQLIGYGNNSSNAFNDFMKTVAGISYNVWNYWGSFNTISSGNDAGYYILDRQLALGGLTALYNSTALANITAASKEAYTAATANYLTRSTYYPSHCEITTTKSIKAMSYPCTSDVDPESTVVATLSENQTVVGNALFCNTLGEYWYRIICYGDTPAYIYAGDTTFVRELRTDVRIENSNAPSNIATGNVFVVKGDIKTTYNLITGVSAYALKGFDLNGEIATGTRTATYGFNYSLQGSTLDNALEFNKLAAGNYTYAIWMNVENHHALSGSEKTSTVTAILIKEAYFTVGGSSDVYTVLYNGNGGAVSVTSQPKLKGTALTITDSVPMREGYEFLGWSESATAAEPDYLAGGNFTADANTTLYAVWKSKTEAPPVEPVTAALGDVNSDGAINQYDYILVKRHYFGTRYLTDDETTRGDVNRDGTVNQFDYILICRHY
ncbi:MAG: InlB B-repeat-containing protein, partial [Clostridia bacterium]|nr:InlB B-repeat-containing protein [Clostridia bacterium]